jgi:pre-mRNA-splicing helicase BRR2
MLQSPSLYSVGPDYISPDDPSLIQKRSDIIHSAAVLLEKCQLVRYDRVSGEYTLNFSFLHSGSKYIVRVLTSCISGRLTPTELGKIASHYYVEYSSMMTYIKHLQPTMGMLELFRVFSLSGEFRLLPVRQEVSTFSTRNTTLLTTDVRCF